MADTEARDRAADERPTHEVSADVGEDGAPSEERPARGKHEHGSGRRFIGSTPFLILLALVVALIVKTFFVQAFFIPSESMEPTLLVGDRVFVNKLVYDLGDIGRGDVIVFENPHPGAVPHRGPISGFLHWLGEGIGIAQPRDEDFIKRVIALPGETIEIRNDVVYVDGQRLDEPYLTEDAVTHNGDFPLRQVPNDALFVMGDNRGDSADSRFGLGFVPIDKVVGRAFVIIWPPSDIGGI